jgi:hypothetical protein
MVKLVQQRDRLKIKTGGTDEPTAVQPSSTSIQPNFNTTRIKPIGELAKSTS